MAVAIQQVIPSASIERNITVPTNQRIVPATTVKDVCVAAAAQRIVAIPAIECVIVSSTINNIVTIPAIECVIVSPTINNIVTRTAINCIAPSTTVNRVVTPQTIDRIGVIRPPQLIILFRCNHILRIKGGSCPDRAIAGELDLFNAEERQLIRRVFDAEHVIVLIDAAHRHIR